ncbi:hypothetical protein PspLS_07370 [Pyricularia sp. CBS 133598]|nr:hypothetical protein PspLS_07370 [Pyricularia sp. CBS 133598]
MQLKGCRSIWLAFVCCLFISWTLGSALPPVKRQNSPAAPTAINPPSSTTSSHASMTTIPPTGATGSLNASSATANVTATDGIYNITIPQGELPLDPVITPAWGVAGVILLGTGAVYALIGIKIRVLHTFFSTAFLSALGTCVLIVYVMVPPIPDGIQGAYLVAIVLTGVALGGLAMVFKEITEGLGCLLGGVCLSMWLLTLKEGGLLTGMGTKGGFVAAIALGAFAFYFSHHTRHYALIASTSFSGATAVVLGIDSFSRAGLKEFWAYIWALNDRLFPLGTVTYPLTRGIRVEIAITIVIFIAGVVSQLKLWLIIKQHRQKQEVERLEARRNLDEEEARVGRQIEEAAAADRRDWEAIHGDGQYQEGQTDSPTNSASGSITNEKGIATVKQVDSTARSTEIKSTEVVEMSGEDEKGPTKRLQNNPMSKSNLTLVHYEEVANPEPVVVPLPFNPSLPKEGETGHDDNASSVAAYAGDEDELAADSGSNKRLSSRQMSHAPIMMRSLSPGSKRASLTDMMEHSQSRELLMTKSAIRDDQRSSIEVTFDDMSTGEKEDRLAEDKDAEDSEVAASLARKPSSTDVASALELATVATADITVPAPSETGKQSTLVDAAPTTITDDVDTARVSQDGESNKSHLPEPAADTVMEKAGKLDEQVKSPEAPKKAVLADELPQAMSRVAMSHRTNEWAKHLSLAETPVLETLKFEDLDLSDATDMKPKVEEQPAPVNTEELQQTANNAALPLAISRPPSTLSFHQPQTPQALTTPSQSRLSWHPDTQFKDGGDSTQAAADQTYKRTPSTSRPSVPAIVPILKEPRSFRPMPTMTPPPMLDAKALRRQSASPGPSVSASVAALNRQAVPGVVSYASPQTLIGQRDVIVRKKSTLSGLQSGLMESLPVNHSANAGELVYSATPTLYAASPPPSPYPTSPDDVPLSRRRELMMRQQSLISLSGNEALPNSPYIMPNRSQSRASIGNLSYLTGAPGPSVSSDALAFDSHQPRRASIAPSPEVRESQLAYFRNSLAAEMRAGPMLGGRQSPGLRNVVGVEADNVNVELHRGIMLGQRDAEMQKRDIENTQRVMAEFALDERMRSSEMQEAHRNILRKMQASVKDT